ncbi:hypothetical protein AHF37_02339 [Paragonimus kellicotti]|nr:hypothetical protein AHF37_02339 [Paragonimus kellicotti]
MLSERPSRGGCGSKLTVIITGSQSMLFPEDQIWMIVVGFIIAFILAFGIGANDVANSFGTSVGAKVLTLRQACILATICEISGAVLLGAKVSNTIRKGIVNTDLFVEHPNGPATLMAGQVAALSGSCIWLLVATFFRLPVSGTHSIVGATIGFSMITFGLRSVQWVGVVKISKCSENKLEPALRMLPGFYGTVVLVNTFSIFYSGPPMLYFDRIPLYGVFILSCGISVITVICVKYCWVPSLRRRIIAGTTTRALWKEKLSHIRTGRLRIVSHQNSGSIVVPPLHTDDGPSTASMNETTLPTEEHLEMDTCHQKQSNANALSTPVNTAEDEPERNQKLKSLHKFSLFPDCTSDQQVAVPKIYKVPTDDLSINNNNKLIVCPQSQAVFTGSTNNNADDSEDSAVMAKPSIITHQSLATITEVGSVVGVGRARAKDSVNWSIFRNILIAWLVTLPAAGGIAALLMYGFTFLI